MKGRKELKKFFQNLKNVGVSILYLYYKTVLCKFKYKTQNTESRNIQTKSGFIININLLNCFNEDTG